MEKLLIEFINTLDLTLKKLHEEAGGGVGISNLTINQFRYIDAINDLPANYYRNCSKVKYYKGFCNNRN